MQIKRTIPTILACTLLLVCFTSCDGDDTPDADQQNQESQGATNAPAADPNPQDPPAMPPPWLISPADGAQLPGGYFFDFEWAQPESATSYTLTVGGKDWPATGSPESLMLDQAGTFQWYVTAHTPSGDLVSDIQDFTVDYLPHLVSPEDDASVFLGATVEFEWEAVDGATSYKFYYDDDLIAETAATSYSMACTNLDWHFWWVVPVMPGPAYESEVRAIKVLKLFILPLW